MLAGAGSGVRRQPLAGVAMKELRHRTIQLLEVRDRCLQALTEPNVHELRLAARHLQPVLGFLHALDPARRNVQRARKQIHAILDLTGPLRDGQLRRITLTATRAGGPWPGTLLRVAMSEERSMMKRTAVRLARIDLAVLMDLGARSLEPRSTLDARHALQRALRHRHERLRAKVGKLHPGDPRSLHKARIALKRYRYLVETFAAYIPPSALPKKAQLKRVQQQLGRWHDERVLAEWLLKNGARLTGDRAQRCREMADARIRWCAMEQERLVSRLKTIVHTRSRARA